MPNCETISCTHYNYNIIYQQIRSYTYKNKFRTKKSAKEILLSCLKSNVYVREKYIPPNSNT